MDPLTTGEYPKRMQSILGDRLPSFTEAEKALIKGSIDFVGLNYYFPYESAPGTASIDDEPGFFKDMNISDTFAESWPLSQTGWGIYAPGLRDLLLYTSKRCICKYFLKIISPLLVSDPHSQAVRNQTITRSYYPLEFSIRASSNRTIY